MNTNDIIYAYKVILLRKKLAELDKRAERELVKIRDYDKFWNAVRKYQHLVDMMQLKYGY